MVLCMFSKGMEIRNLNEAEVLAILKVLRVFSQSFQGSLIVESNSSNMNFWFSQDKCKPWKLHFNLNEIKFLASHLQVVFHHIIRSANRWADVVANQGVGRITPWEVIL